LDAIPAGRGRLVFTRVGARTVLEAARANAPLKLLTPDNHGHAAWVFATSFGGGLVDGDAIELSVRVGVGASALVATQSQTKVFRGARGATQGLDADVADGALLVLLPDPVACFAGARYSQRTTLALDTTATVIAVETFTSGRRAHGERWSFGRYASRLAILRGGKHVLADAVLLDAAHGAIESRMRGFDAMATVVAVGPGAERVRASLLAAHGERVRPPQRAPAEGNAPALAVAASELGPDAAIARIAGPSAQAVMRRVQGLLAPLVASLGDDPFARKW
jgi:urease accessory protein